MKQKTITQQSINDQQNIHASIVHIDIALRPTLVKQPRGGACCSMAEAEGLSVGTLPHAPHARQATAWRSLLLDGGSGRLERGHSAPCAPHSSSNRVLTVLRKRANMYRLKIYFEVIP
jgi:hypothetical protein